MDRFDFGVWKSKYELKNYLVCLSKTRGSVWWLIFLIVARMFFALLFPIGLAVLWFIQFFNSGLPWFIYWMFGLFGVMFLVASVCCLFYLDTDFYFDSSRREIHKSSVFLGRWAIKIDQSYSVDLYTYVYVDMLRRHLVIFLKRSDGESVPLYVVKNLKEGMIEANKVGQILGLPVKAL